MNARFAVLSTPINGLQVLRRLPRRDPRGFLERVYCETELEPFTRGKPIVQINHTHTRQRGTVRGLHFQYPPHAEIKFVSCLRGEVFDVAVDLRRGSRTFLQWHAERLCEDNFHTLVIPEGFAHGFQTLADDCELLYLHTAAHCSTAEDGLHAQDPALGIDWPLPIVDLSDRDSSRSMLKRSLFAGIPL